MFKKLNPSFSFLFLAVSLWGLEYGFDSLVGDADRKITFLNIYVFIVFVQFFLVLSAFLWLPEVVRRIKGNFPSTSEHFLKRNTASIFICFTLFLILLLDCFGFAFFDKRDVERVHRPSHYRAQHPCFHHGFIQNAAVETFWGDIKYSLYTNSFAFRDSAVFEARQDLSKKQIFFIGDSFTEGVGVVYENTFFGRMREEFSNNDKIELWNAGCVSYSPLIYYNKIKYYTEIEKLKIDYLWVFIDGSDIQDELNYKDFQPNCNEKYIPRAGTEDYYRYKIINDTSFFDIYRNHSLLIRLVSNTYKNLFTDQNTEEKMFYINNRLAWLDDEKIYQDWGKKGVKLAEVHMQSLVELCKEKNIKLSIAVYPWSSMMNNYNRQLEIWTTFSQKNNIPLLNLFTVFAQKLEETAYDKVDEKYFIKGDGHWNAEGHLLVKETIKAPFEKMILNETKRDTLIHLAE